MHMCFAVPFCSLVSLVFFSTPFPLIRMRFCVFIISRLRSIIDTCLHNIKKEKNKSYNVYNVLQRFSYVLVLVIRPPPFQDLRTGTLRLVPPSLFPLPQSFIFLQSRDLLLAFTDQGVRGFDTKVCLCGEIVRESCPSSQGQVQSVYNHIYMLLASASASVYLLLVYITTIIALCPLPPSPTQGRLVSSYGGEHSGLQHNSPSTPFLYGPQPVRAIALSHCASGSFNSYHSFQVDEQTFVFFNPTYASLFSWQSCTDGHEPGLYIQGSDQAAGPMYGGGGAG